MAMSNEEKEVIIDRLLRLKSKIDSFIPVYHKETIIGPYITHKYILENGVKKLENILKENSYAFKVIVKYLQSLEDYFTLVTNPNISM